MKSIMLHIQNNDGLEARFQCALDITRAVEGHLSCVQTTPVYTYNASGFFVNPLALDKIVEDLDEQAEVLETEMRSRLEKEDVAWDYRRTRNFVLPELTSNSLLADLVIVGPIHEASKEQADVGLLGEMILNIRPPVLVVPDQIKRFNAAGTALVAWNDSVESAHALQAAIPLLKLAEKVIIVSVEGKKSRKSLDEFPSTAASEYLSRHGILSELRVEKASKIGVTDALTISAKALQADYIVMGAYGHSRVREYLFGGVTRAMLEDAKIPIVFSH